MFRVSHKMSISHHLIMMATAAELKGMSIDFFFFFKAVAFGSFFSLNAGG